ncbi:reverse transcriptase domain-containing protein [Tanacetum coccineum]
MTPIIQFLEKGVWPEDKNKARSLRVKINQYAMENGVLFKKSYIVPMLRCVGPLQANYVIREIHMGSCGMQSGPRGVVRKAMRQGYYWSTMHEDARKEIQKCDSCQIHLVVPKLPKTFMTSIMAPWSFYQWDIDILGPLPQASGRIKYVIVAIDYFTKWIEAKLLVKITDNDVIHFVLDNIICRFGLPRIIITDNGTQFVNDPFKSWCARLNIQHMNTVVAYPQANGLVERANKSLMEGIKTRIGREEAGWVDEGDSAEFRPVDRKRELAAIQEAKYKTKLEQYYNKRVHLTSFKPGEFVFRKNEASRVENQGKLGPKWEGPYRVEEAYQNGSYKLQTMKDKEVPRTWHAINLRKCYL